MFCSQSVQKVNWLSPTSEIAEYWGLCSVHFVSVVIMTYLSLADFFTACVSLYCKCSMGVWQIATPKWYQNGHCEISHMCFMSHRLSTHEWSDLWITFFDTSVTDITSRIRRVVLTFGGIYDTLTGIQLNNRVKQCDPNHKNTFPTRPRNRLICQSPLIDFQYKD
jgi:hypothetical protein